MIEWPAVSVVIGSTTTRVVCPLVPHIRHATGFVVGVTLAPDAAAVLRVPVAIRQGRVSVVEIPSAAIRNQFPRGGLCWLTLRDVTGALVARGRLTLTP